MLLALFLSSPFSHIAPRQPATQLTMHKTSLILLLLVGPLLTFIVVALPIDTGTFTQAGVIKARTKEQTHHDSNLRIHLGLSSE